MSKYRYDTHFNSSITGKSFYTILFFLHNGLLFDHKLNIKRLHFHLIFCLLLNIFLPSKISIKT